MPDWLAQLIVKLLPVLAESVSQALADGSLKPDHAAQLKAGVSQVHQALDAAPTQQNAP